MMSASVTVETTLVMPVVLACLVLLIVINGYLHDMVVMNGISTEILYADAESEDAEKLFRETTQGQLFWKSNVDYSENEDPMKKTIIWKNKSFFPLKGILNMIIGETNTELSGKVIFIIVCMCYCFFTQMHDTEGAARLKSCKFSTKNPFVSKLSPKIILNSHFFKPNTINLPRPLLDFR